MNDYNVWIFIIIINIIQLLKVIIGWVNVAQAWSGWPLVLAYRKCVFTADGKRSTVV